MPPSISVLVPTRGRPARLAALLERLDRQTAPAESFEVVVVDDGSEPLLALDAASHRSRPRLVRQAPGGPAAARNRGLAECTAPLVLILNDDALPADDLVAGHVEAHAERERAGSAPCAVLGRFDFAPAALESAFTRLLQGSDLLFDFPGLVDGAELGWTFFWTCNISLPRALLLEERFDAERFREPLLEDVELGYRLAARGLCIVHRAELVALHDHVLEPAGWLARQTRLGANLVKMARKHGDMRLLRAARADVSEEEALRPHQLAFEALWPKMDEVLSVLEAFDAAWRGKEPPAELARGMQALMRRIGPVAVARGVLGEVDGTDPAERFELGDHSGALTSVIVPSCDALSSTQACVEALVRCAERGFPLEIVVVDNGSTDGSREWLAARDDLRLVVNEENEGAPRARNQALALARGEWIVFLDNDVVVTPGWLSRLRWHAELDPRAACIGPVTRRAAHGQAEDFPAGAPDEVARAVFAARPRTARLTGLMSSFCLLVRRARLDEIGVFDERFSPWGFEDDDLTLRCLAAGWHNRIALDVFVEHGSYAGARARRHDELLERNWARFRDKWGLPPQAARGDYTGLERIVEELRAARHAERELVLAADGGA